MLRKAELGKLPVQFAHDPIPGDFGDDAGRRDGKRETVSFHDGVMGKRKIPDGESIDQAVVRLGEKGFRGPAHRQMSRPQDVELVDFPAVRSGHSPDDLWVSSQLFVKKIALPSTDFFGIVESGTGKTAGQNDCRRSYGAGERPPARFIHACDPLKATGEKSGFEGQIGHGVRID